MRRSLPLLPIALALLAPSPAGAQDPGVRLDPSNAAAKEYAVPAGAARAIGAGQPPGTAAPGAGAPAAPLFGAGVKPRRRGSHRVAASPAARRPRGAADSGGGERIAEGRDAHADAAEPTRRPAAVRPSAMPVSAPTVPGLSWMGGTALAVLSGGAALGWALRRKRPQER